MNLPFPSLGQLHQMFRLWCPWLMWWAASREPFGRKSKCFVKEGGRVFFNAVGWRKSVSWERLLCFRDSHFDCLSVLPFPFSSAFTGTTPPSSCWGSRGQREGKPPLERLCPEAEKAQPPLRPPASLVTLVKAGLLLRGFWHPADAVEWALVPC